MLCKHFIYAQDIRCGCYWRKRPIYTQRERERHIDIHFALCATKKSGYRKIAHVVHVSYCDLWHFVCYNLFETRAFRIHFDFWAFEQQSASYVFLYSHHSSFLLCSMASNTIQYSTTTLSQTPFQSFLSLQSNLLSVMNRFFPFKPVSTFRTFIF